MLTPAVEDWIKIVTPCVSAFATIVALGISAWVATTQRRNQKAQLKQSLFDKRYAVYLQVEQFVMYVLRTDGSIKLTDAELQRFRSALEQSEFLFDSDVIAYMKEIYKKGFTDLYPKCAKRDHLTKMGQDDPDLSLEIIKLVTYIEGPLLEKRQNVFGPYLKLKNP